MSSISEQNVEPFLDLVDVESSDLTFSPVTVSKTGPLSVGTDASTDSSYVAAFIDAAELRLIFWTTTAALAPNGNMQTASAPDGSTFGAVSTIEANVVFTDAVIDPKWRMTIEKTAAVSNGLFVFSSSDLSDATQIKQQDFSEYSEGKSLVQKEDGTWLLYFNYGHAADTRTIRAYSASTLTGPYTDEGDLLVPDTFQMYGIGVHRFASVWAVFVSRYDEVSEQIHTALYATRDGLSFTQVEEQWLPLGAGGSWDDEMIIGPKTIVEWDGNWRFYYSGSPVKHDASRPFGMKIGYASVPVGRLMESSGTGVIRTISRTWNVLNVNADGAISIQVLDDTNTPIPGLATADYDSVVASGSFEPTWGGDPIPPGTTGKLEITLSAGEVLYSYDWSEWQPTEPFSDDFTGTDGDPWDVDLWSQDAGSGGGATTIQSNRGNARGSTGNANSGGRGRGKQGQVPNQEMTGTFQLCEVDEPCRGALWLQTSDDWNGLDWPTHGYGVRLPSDSDTATLLLASGGVVSTLDSAIWPRDTGLKRFRFRRQNTKVRFRIWDDGDSEPEGWLLVGDDDTIGPDTAGVFQVAYTCPTAPSVDACADFDTLIVEENNDPIDSGSATCAFDSGFSSGFAICTAASNRMGGTGAIRKPPRNLVRR